MARRQYTADEAVAALRALANADNLAGMARFGIETGTALGVSMPGIRSVAARISHDHQLAQDLWQSGIHEARILAGLVDKPHWVTPDQMKRWTADFNSWDVCDQICGSLFDKTPYTDAMIVEWAASEHEFVKRAAFATIAWKAVHDKKADDAGFLPFLALIREASTDHRNFVKKAVNWALRQIGKRSAQLHAPALALAQELASSTDKTARWIGRDAVRELQTAAVVRRLGLS
ncbi:MAG: DNA alkylation repair protein [Nitratireductor sp.]|nr:DNA alkylation repair protein [Nitratireductor sp.]